MNNNNYNIEKKECSARGVCSLAPTIVALQRLSLKFLQEISFYVIKLEDHGAFNPSIKQKILKYLVSLSVVSEFNEEQIYEMIQEQYYLLLDTKNNFNKLKLDINSDKENLLNIFNINTTLPDSIKIGEKLLANDTKNGTKKQNLYQILLIVLFSISNNALNLQDFIELNKNNYTKIIKTLTQLYSSALSEEIIDKYITDIVILDSEIEVLYSDKLLEIFGGITKKEVSYSTQKGKAILISGNNFTDLLNLLKLVEGSEISIYTHSDMLIAHAFNLFNKYKNFKGHFKGKNGDNILEFSTFPGPILLTNNSKTYNEYLYRGLIFSTDYIVPKGVIKLENNNYEKLIEQANISHGFKSGKTKSSTIVGYDVTEVNNKINNIISKINNGNIKKLYIISTADTNWQSIDNFKSFYENLTEDDFIINFGNEIKLKKVLNININNFTPLAINILKNIFKEITISDDRLVFMFTKCDYSTLSEIIMLNDKKAKNIYMIECSPNTINPTVYKFLCKKYNILNIVEL